MKNLSLGTLGTGVRLYTATMWLYTGTLFTQAPGGTL